MKSQYLKFKILKYSFQISNFKLKIVLIGLLGYLFIGLLPKAHAEGVSLTVNPAILRIEAVAPSDIRAPFTITNQGDEPITLKVGYRLFKPAAEGNGQIEFLEDKDPFPGADKQIFDKVQVIDDNLSIDSVELGPKQKKKLVLRIALPKGEPSSDYYFSLIFLSPAKEPEAIGDSEQNSFTSSQAGIAINVLLSIGAKENDKVYIEKFSGPFYVESGPYPFSLQLKNTGSHYVTPT